MTPEENLMKRALKLARRGFPTATPNPLVGCVLVKNGRIIAEGYHRNFGGPHAETEALRQAGSRARGAIAYLNLEPCSHFGLTPPCVNALKEAGVKEVVAALEDPNPLVRGRGFRALKASGIKIRAGVLSKEATALNLPFLTQMRLGRPYIILKAAITLDGKIADSLGRSKWVTGPQARRHLWKLRSLCDAIAVGSRTVIKDNPEITSHGLGRNPLRVILDPRLKISPQAKVFRTNEAGTLLATAGFNLKSYRIMSQRNVEWAGLAVNGQGLNLNELCKILAIKGIQTLLVEGGGITHGYFTAANLLDEAAWFIAPKILGGRDATPSIAGQGRPMARAIPLHNLQASRHGDDFLLRATRNPEGILWPLLE
ncbi:MAG: bifunctional diaminohydroxyphosphoribosylaminopyrimidine deaminase/5-amino-6-(5-phosphoribosylamino)uracil reductase RibD [Elusimicrobiota bacterium]